MRSRSGEDSALPSARVNSSPFVGSNTHPLSHCSTRSSAQPAKRDTSAGTPQAKASFTTKLWRILIAGVGVSQPPPLEAGDPFGPFTILNLVV